MDKSCRPNDLGIYYSYDEAREKCSELNKCEMFYDSGGNGTYFCLCGSGATALKVPRYFLGFSEGYSKDPRSILYVKKSK